MISIEKVTLNIGAGSEPKNLEKATKLLEKFRRLDESEEETHRKSAFRLSKRETEVLAMVADGSSNRDIANALFISENTVKVHLSKILEKLHVQKRQQAALIALKKRIIPKRK